MDLMSFDDGEDKSPFYDDILATYHADQALEDYFPFRRLSDTMKAIRGMREDSVLAQQRQRAENAFMSSVHLRVSPSTVIGRSSSFDVPVPQTFGDVEWTSEKVLREEAAAHDEFAREFNGGLRHVEETLAKLEDTALAGIQKLRGCTAEELKGWSLNDFANVLLSIRHVASFREVNAKVARHILRKYVGRCCTDSLDLQKIAKTLLTSLQRSTLHASRKLDIDVSLQTVCVIYAKTHHVKSYDEARNELQRRMQQDDASKRRVVHVRDSFYYASHYPHRYLKGQFALRVVSSMTSRRLSKSIGRILKCNVTAVTQCLLSRGEIDVSVDEAVRGDDVYVVATLAQTDDISLSSAVMNLALLIHAVRKAAAQRIHAVIPYLPYGTHIASMAVISEILISMGADSFITVDLDVPQVEGTFNGIPVRSLSMQMELVHYLTRRFLAEGVSLQDVTVVSPAPDAVPRARALVETFLNDAYAQSDRATHPVVLSAGNLQGFMPIVTTMSNGEGRVELLGPDVRGRVCIVVECSLHSAQRALNVAERLHRGGARRIVVAASHGAWVSGAMEKLVRSCIDEVIVSDSIDQRHALEVPAMARKLRVLPIGPLLAQCMQRAHNDNGLNSYFD